MVTAAIGCVAVGVAGAATVPRGAGASATIVGSEARGFGVATGVGLLTAIGACGVGLAATIGAGAVGVTVGTCGAMPGVACGVLVGGALVACGLAVCGAPFTGGVATGGAPFGDGVAVGGAPFGDGAPFAGGVAVGGTLVVDCMAIGVDCAPFGMFAGTLGVGVAAPPPDDGVDCAIGSVVGTAADAPASGVAFAGRGFPVGAFPPDAVAPCGASALPIVSAGSPVAPSRAVSVRPGLFAAIPATRLASASSVVGLVTVFAPFVTGGAGRCAVVTPATPR